MVILRKMTDAISHRGPDGEGWYTNGCAGLGHRRLAVIDPSAAGHQPMTNPGGRFIISYNGEIYNFNELRIELKSMGHFFNSRTDTEVVLNAYEQWGPGCLDRFNGMFAFAIWDKKEKELFIARDRYGIKPLYYSFAGNSFVFASEQKAILAHPDSDRSIDMEAMLEYFTFQNIFTDKTFFKRIKIFPPGSWAKISARKQINALKTTPFWDYDFREPEEAATEAEYIEELDRLFKQAVNRQLVSDVELGTFLSGGMDSGSITAIAAKQIPYIKSFTCGFDMHSTSGLELSFDERVAAEHLSYLFRTEHYEMVLKAGDMERALPRLSLHVEEPRVGQCYPNYYTSQLASKFVKVILAGTGGDELFGGYPWRYYRAVVNDDFENYIDKYYLFWQRLLPNKELQKVFSPVWNEVSHVWTRDIFRDVFKRKFDSISKPENYVNHSLYFEARTFLHGLLVVEDKIGMAHGLETRFPFLDNDLVDFATHIPVQLKLKSLGDVVRLNENEPGGKSKIYYMRTNDGKLILRKMMKKYVPEEITNGVKQGFSAPDASWFRGDSIDFVRKIISDRNSRIYDFLSPEAVQNLVDDHLEGRKNRRLLIWSLLNFEWWRRNFC